MFHLLYGTKSARAEIYKRMTEDTESGRRAYLIVPDQKALLAESALMQNLPRSAALRADAVGFSRLANLVCRKYGGLTYRYADSGTRLLTVFRAKRKLNPQLKVYTETVSSGTYEALSSLFTEFRACAVTPQNLADAAEKTDDPALADKLSDLSLLYEEYEFLLHERYAEAADDLDTLTALLQKHDFFGDARVYLDSFVSFTGQQIAVLQAMLARGTDVTVALPYRRAPGAHTAECADTRARLLALCAKLGVKLDETETESHDPQALAYAKENLWNFGHTDVYEGESTRGVLEVVRCADKIEEAEFCTREIATAIENGASYADIAVIARNAGAYTGILDRLLGRCGIPYFFSEKKSAAFFPLTELILSALSLYVYDFKERDVAAYLGTGLCGLSDAEIDLFSEYIDRWRINGAVRYLGETDFTMSDAGYTANGTPPEAVNEIRRKLAAPLSRLCDTLSGASTVRDFTEAIFTYLEEMQIRERSTDPAFTRYLGADRTAEAVRLWNVTMEAFDTLADAAGDESVTAAEYGELVRLLFGAIDVAQIPSSMDQVVIGDADTVRIDERKIVLLIGAVEGAFPAPVSESPTLCERERKKLSDLGVELSQNLLLRSARELYHFVRAIDFASRRVTVSYYTADADGKETSPSFAVERLFRLFGDKLYTYSYSALPPLERIFYPAVAAERVGSFDRVTESAVCRVLSARGIYAPPLTDPARLTNANASLLPETAARIYGDRMTLSQSKIDRYTACKLGHFFDYILRLEDTAPFEFNPANTGTFVHSVLEEFMKSARAQKRSVGSYTKEELHGISVNLCAAETERILKSAGVNARMLAFFTRMQKNVELILQNLTHEFAESGFEPFLFEYKIGADGHRPLRIELPDAASVSLVGVADRVDVCKKDGKVYLRIVDYKTGIKDFKESDLAKGKNLQLLIYLFTLAKVADENFFRAVGVTDTEQIVPAAATYFVVKTPKITRDAVPDADEDLQRTAEDTLTRKGFLLSEDALADLIDRSADRRFSAAHTEKDRAEMDELFATVCQSVKNIACEMRSGRIDTSETPDAKSGSPCAYCAYTGICRRENEQREESEDG